ncbi:Puf6p Ecym_3593 [Eremothecium cymbalariae DBVPG|uniref:PUM-HD domain-containing protein n=1 Tax=Eremothecium cymbalariae (strain CBS 270.75 / DBVPG 7215 / KCTC 17166 / NRRL Y-17582) TaxID=931890 RepID=G8JQS5_ERECY|nr:Hypothetical protein Ecym_3593 [Eremothecium cymbalariae DBVPG\
MSPVNKGAKHRLGGERVKKVTKKPRIAVDSSDEDYPSSDNDHLTDQEGGDDDDDLDDLDDIISDKEEEDGDDGQTEQKLKEGGQHVEQRKLLKERKMQRKSGVEVQQIKSLWEKLRVKQPPMPREVREKFSNQVWELSKDCILDLVLKHDASRIVQTLVKYSPRERREQIVEALKGKFYVLATSAYGKYLLVKLLHYGTKHSRQIIIDELHGNLRKLMRHREGAHVVEDLFVLYASQEQRNQMIREFWGSEYSVFRDAHKDLTIEQVCESSVEKRNIIARNLVGTITASVEKGSTGFQILHAAMKEYIKIANEKEISEFIEILQDQFAELVHTAEGSDVACVLISKANAKERKSIIKNLKDHAENLIKNQYGNQVFITLLMTVDDTVLLYKAFAPVVKDKLKDFLVDKWGRRPFLYIIVGLDGKYFSPLIKQDLERYIELSNTTSKKPFEQRRLELLKKFGLLFIDCLSDELPIILKDSMGCQFVSEIVTNDELYQQLSEEHKTKFQELIDAIVISFKGDISEEEHPIHRPFSVRLLKSMIQGGKWNNKEKILIPLAQVQGLGIPFAQKFYDEIIDSNNLLDWINNPSSSFTIVSLYDTLHAKKQGTQFMKDLKALKKKEIHGNEDNKGAQLLLNLLKQEK